MTDSSNTIDLDALAPQPVTIKFDDAEIQVAPPKTGDVFRLAALGKQMVNAEALDEAELDTLVEQLTQQVYKCIPDLADKPLNTAQLLKLVQILSEMSMPADAKELEALGIKTDSPKKTP